MAVSLLAFMTYLRERRSGYLILSAIIAGLSWLTKSPGVFLIPIVGLLALLDLFRRNVPSKTGGTSTGCSVNGAGRCCCGG